MEKEKTNIHKFKDYLNKGNLCQKHELTKNGNLYFHWANWAESCKYQKSLLYKNSKQSKRLKNLEAELEKLKDIPIWLSIKNERHEICLYDLYKAYLDPRLKSAWFDVHSETLVSSQSISGPYVTLHSMRWFEKDTYEKFIYLKILSNYVPLRSFRLGVNVPVKAFGDDSPLKDIGMTLYQLSKDGCVFKIKGQLKIANLLNSEKLTMKMRIRPFKNVIDAGFDDVIKAFSKIDFSIINDDELSVVEIDRDVIDRFGKDEGVRFSNGDEFFLYVPYHQMKLVDDKYKISEIFTSLVNKVEFHLLDELQEDLIAA
ncbi:hypothetical protein HBN50_02645 [Halobacteriovorax sp. GB3]|uniref:hypothetical protein n=1 Tax=Halobacteriovorax sp. GB3 TaxID=2719615 RepID=UPI0023601231|nr:hypothetical protein [Halobacteriovorax sp. GB3]MDD0851973.1 hypothetical protein [Halobacteriovorax sp. GB3]